MRIMGLGIKRQFRLLQRPSYFRLPLSDAERTLGGDTVSRDPTRRIYQKKLMLANFDAQFADYLCTYGTGISCLHGLLSRF